MAFYAGARGVQVNDQRLAPGTPVPEAARWEPGLRAVLVREGHLVEREPFTCAELLELLDTRGLKELCKRRGIEAGTHGRLELVAELLASVPPDLAQLAGRGAVAA